MRGKLISIDGMDGAGKTSLIKNISRHYNSKVLVVDTFLERKMISELNNLAKQYDTSTSLLFSERTINIAWLTDLFSNSFRIFEDLLDQGHNLVLDRYILSAKVYSAATTKSDISNFFSIYDLLVKPDLCLLLDTSIEIAMKRIDKRGLPKTYYENEEYLEKIKNTYLDLKDKENYPVKVIDADYNQEHVLREAMKLLKEFDILY